MPKTLKFSVLLASLTLLVLPTEAFAINARQAILACDLNPRCDYNVLDNGDVVITVGDVIVECPQEGECSCVGCSTRLTPERVLRLKSPLLTRPQGGPVLSQ